MDGQTWVINKKMAGAALNSWQKEALSASYDFIREVKGQPNNTDVAEKSDKTQATPTVEN